MAYEFRILNRSSNERLNKVNRLIRTVEKEKYSAKELATLKSTFTTVEGQ